MGVELSGFDGLYKKLEALGNVGNKVGNEALKDGAEIVLEQQKKDAPRSNDGDNGADKLLIDKIKRYKSGTKTISIGITKDNWEDVEHLVYQHFGYELWKNGERVEKHINWMNDSFEKVKDKATTAIKNKVEQEINKILD